MSAAPQITSQMECRNLGVGVVKGPRLATVDVQIAAGRFTAILGPNGAGKSTLMSMLVGERVPQCGQVLLDGHPLASHGMASLAQRRFCSCCHFLWNESSVNLLDKEENSRANALPASPKGTSCIMTLTQLS